MMSWIELLKKLFIKSYKVVIEFLFAFYRVVLRSIFGQACKHSPTCSEYAHEAYKIHNPFYATVLTAKRLLSCNPFVEGGYDPVPRRGQR